MEAEIDLCEGRQPHGFFHAGELTAVCDVSGVDFCARARLERLKLRVELGHFIGFVISRKRALPFGERTFHQRSGTLIAAKFQIYFCQMTKNGWVVGGLVHGLLQIFFRFG